MHDLRSNPLGKNELVPRSYLVLSLWTAKQIGLHKRRHGSPDFFPSPRLASPHPSRQQAESLDISVSDSITSNSDSITARQAAVDCPMYDVSGIATSRRKTAMRVRNSTVFCFPYRHGRYLLHSMPIKCAPAGTAAEFVGLRCPCQRTVPAVIVAVRVAVMPQVVVVVE